MVKVRLKVKRVSAWRGLMFRRRPKIPMAFPCKGGIHTCFVFFKIDAAFISDFGDLGKVMDVVRNLGPFRSYNPKAGHEWVVEAPAGKLGLEVGDRVRLA